MNRIHLTAKFTIPAEHLEEFQTLSQVLIARVRETEPTTEEYLWFYNEARTECVVRETYPDSAALLTHMANGGEELGRIIEIAKFQLEVCGPASDELRAAAPPHTSFYPTSGGGS